MGAQEGRHQLDRLLGCQAADHAQHLQLGLAFEAVSALHLGRCRPRRGASRPGGASSRPAGDPRGPPVSRATVPRIPPPAAAISAYVAPARRRWSSWRRSPAKTACVCGSTKPGTTVRRAQLMTVAPGAVAPRRSHAAEGPAKTMRPAREATVASGMGEASRCAGPRRGAGPAHVYTDRALVQDEVRDHRARVIPAPCARRTRPGHTRWPDCRGVGLPRAVQEDLLLALPRLLVLHEVEGVAQGGDHRLDRGLDVAPLQLQAVDLALHVLEARLGLLEQQLGAPLGLLATSRRASCSAPDLISSASRWAVSSVLRRLRSCSRCSLTSPSSRVHLLAEPVRVAQRLLVVVGDLVEQRRHLVRVEPAERRPELLLPEVEGRHLHRAPPAGAAAPAGQPREPKIAVPTRTIVAPSSMATSKSWLMPIESSRSIAAGDATRPRGGHAVPRSRRNHGRAASGSSRRGGSSISPTTRARRQPRARSRMPAAASGAAP